MAPSDLEGWKVACLLGRAKLFSEGGVKIGVSLVKVRSKSDAINAGISFSVACPWPGAKVYSVQGSEPYQTVLSHTATTDELQHTYNKTFAPNVLKLRNFRVDFFIKSTLNPEHEVLKSFMLPLSMLQFCRFSLDSSDTSSTFQKIWSKHCISGVCSLLRSEQLPLDSNFFSSIEELHYYFPDSLALERGEMFHEVGLIARTFSSEIEAMVRIRVSLAISTFELSVLFNDKFAERGGLLAESLCALLCSFD